MQAPSFGPKTSGNSASFGILWFDWKLKTCHDCLRLSQKRSQCSKLTQALGLLGPKAQRSVKNSALTGFLLAVDYNQFFLPLFERYLWKLRGFTPAARSIANTKPVLLWVAISLALLGHYVQQCYVNQQETCCVAKVAEQEEFSSRIKADFSQFESAQTPSHELRTLQC